MTQSIDTTRARLVAGGTHLALAAGAVFMLLPFWLMLRTSFTAPDQIFSGNILALSDFSLENYRRVFAEVPLLRYYLNGIFVVTAIFVGQVIVCVPAAYALSRLRFSGREVGLWLVLAAMMVPYHATAIPIYVLLSRFGMINTHGALILPFIGSAFSVFLLRQFFLSIPQSVFESARLDGASSLRTLVHIVFPMARPAIVTFGILSFVSHWNDYFWPSFVLRNDFAATVPFGIVKFLDQELGADYGPQMAAATLTVLPLLVGFLIAQRQLIAGIAMTSGQVD
ncbi:carbohydrate ABC transporter permease [Nitratireductor sp. PBL-C9]|uniref:carbohydrate ABC transporter permease n=1 Tax=Nitratireductor sp. PBL-C9 TaxID=3435013 RepID=UPI003D7CADB6